MQLSREMAAIMKVKIMEIMLVIMVMVDLLRNLREKLLLKRQCRIEKVQNKRKEINNAY